MTCQCFLFLELRFCHRFIVYGNRKYGRRLLDFGDSPLAFCLQYGPHLQSPYVIVRGSFQFVSFLEYRVVGICHHCKQNSISSFLSCALNTIVLSLFYHCPVAETGLFSIFSHSFLFDLRSSATTESCQFFLSGPRSSSAINSL